MCEIELVIRITPKANAHKKSVLLIIFEKPLRFAT